MSNEIRNKKIINGIIGFVLFFVILFGGFWLIDNRYTIELKAQENNEIINLASPDLMGKEYLGDGVYNLYNSNGVTIDYNIYNGNYAINGVLNANISVFLFNILPNQEYTNTYIYVSGSFGGNNQSIIYRNPATIEKTITSNGYTTNQSNTFITTTQNEYELYMRTGSIYNDWEFKLQLEKGTTATPYQTPLGAIQQHEQFIYDEGYNEGYDEGSSVNIETPGSDMNNDVWLDGNMVSDVYYRYDIIYNGIIYETFEMIQQAYIDGVISANTLLYIELNPMYNFILAKLENQGNGLYYWTEVGTLNPEEPSDIETVIIHKNGVKFGMWNYLWDDFDTGVNVLGNSLIGYENQMAMDYYDYYNGYQDGHWAGSQYGFGEGRKYGYNEGRDEFGEYFPPGSPDGFNGWYGYQDGYDYGLEVGFDDGYWVGLEGNPNNNFGALISTILLGVGTVLGIELLPNITIGAIIAVPIVFGIIAFVLGRKKE